MTLGDFDLGEQDKAWCPGCGNFAIHKILSESFSELKLSQKELVMVSGIGQAAKMPQYLKAHMFNGLHGRALPVAVGVKAANPSLTVIAESGDGDMYGEGGNHFIHCIRRNPDITNIVHNNMVYGLTKGQASPTSPLGMKTSVQVDGVFEKPFNPLAVALALGAPFVARVFCGDADECKKVFKEAIRFKGYALVDVLQPCVTYNKLNTYEWFGENTYYLDDEHDKTDVHAAFKRSLEEDKLALGVLYKDEARKTFLEGQGFFDGDDRPLYEREVDYGELADLLSEVGKA
ncbi:thiamine pyrophosphate-dependent enzyme [Candidatus Altiarchaeota archaeon]